MKRFQNSLLALVAIVVLLTACAGKNIERLQADSTTDLSGNWNDTDSRLVAEEMIQDFLRRPWLAEYAARLGRNPTVTVGRIRNLSHEHINTRTFVSDMERELINAWTVDFIASREERSQVREERADQDLYASEATRKQEGQEIGADLLLEGEINTIIDVERDQKVRFYQVNMTLLDITSNRKVWVGQKKIKKFVEKKRGFRL